MDALNGVVVHGIPPGEVERSIEDRERACARAGIGTAGFGHADVAEMSGFGEQPLDASAQEMTAGAAMQAELRERTADDANGAVQDLDALEHLPESGQHDLLQ